MVGFRTVALALAALLAALSATPVTGIKARVKARSKLQAAQRLRGKRDRQRKHRELVAAVSGEGCKCLNWKDVFTRRNGKCGQGYEHFLSRNVSDTGPRLKASLFQELWEGELCNRLYAKLDSDHCVQQNMGEVSNSVQAGWCYVNSTCNSDKLDLRRLSKKEGGESLSLRMCAPGVDKFLYEKSPHELAQLAMDQGLDMGHLVKMAYPTMGESWEKVTAFFTMNKSLLADDGSVRLKRTVERGNTVIWSSRNGLPPFGVTAGTRAWEVGLRPRARRTVLSDPNNVTVWASVTKFRCVAGCSGKELMDEAPVLQLSKERRHGPRSRADVLQLGAPWARGRGMVQMRRSKRRKGEQQKLVQVQA